MNPAPQPPLLVRCFEQSNKLVPDQALFGSFVAEIEPIQFAHPARRLVEIHLFGDDRDHTGAYLSSITPLTGNDGRSERLGR
jgi:hypothetical protein